MWRLAFVSALLLLAFENASLAQDCGTDEKCLQANYIACANGAMCPADRKCSTDGRRCLSRERVDCGGYSCGPGKVCGPANACVAKNATPGRRSYAADDARHKDSRSVRPNADNNILAYLPEQDKTLMSLKAFIDSHSGAARSTPSSVPAAKTVPQAKQDGGQHVAPANNPATMMQDARNSSSTVTAIKELQAQIKRAEESKAGAEQEIKKLQTKMQELSLKRWQEEADQLKAAASSAVTAPNAESVKMNCKVLGASSASADKFQLQCERQQMTTCDAGSRAK
ncbi:MAG: hypothetical protein HYS63_02955 [Methylocystis sp.]|nr:hypothetical protein [Methylocystis sp.]